MRIADETLDYWAERFIAASLADAMTFDAFMRLSPALRERRIAHAQAIRQMQHACERTLPDAALHGDRVIDPLHHGPRIYRRPFPWRKRSRP